MKTTTGLSSSVMAVLAATACFELAAGDRTVSAAWNFETKEGKSNEGI